MTQEEKLTFCLDWIKKIKGDMSTLDTNRTEALKYFEAKTLGNEIKGRSQVVVSTLSDTIGWVKPALLKMFAGGDDITTLSPRGPEDVQAVELQNELVNYQVKVKNNWFLVLHDWLDEALLLKVGVVKRTWHKETRKVFKEYADLSDAEYMAKVMEIEQAKNAEIIEHAETVVQESIADEFGEMLSPEIKTHDIKIQYTVEDEYPLIEAVPVEEVGYPLNTRDIESCRFFYHRVKLEEWEVRQRYGDDIFERVKEKGSKDTWDAGSNLVTQQRYNDLGGVSFFYDREDDKYTIYECYYRDRQTGDAWLAVLCGDEILKDEANPYGMPPFRLITPHKLAHRVTGLSFHDILKQLMEATTAVKRQLYDNLYFTNNGRYVVDETRVNLDDFLNNNIPGGVVRGDPLAVQAIVPAMLQPWAFQLLEEAKKDTEYRSGVPRSWAGVGSVLNKTFRGQAQQVSQASQRMEMMASLIAEMGIAPLIRDIKDMNIMFLKKKQSVKVANRWIDINPGDIVCQCNVIVNVGIGVTSKDMVVAQMQQLLGLFAQAKKAGSSVVTDQNIYKAMKELVKAMGYRNTDDFVTDPRQTEAIQQLVQLVMMRMQQLQIQDPELMQAVQKVMGLMMMDMPALPPAQDEGTIPGQNMPEMPELPMNAMQPRMTIDGGGFHA